MCFLSVNASLAWLNNVVGVYLVKVSLLLIGQQGLADFFRYRPPLAGGLCKFYANPGETQSIQRQLFLVQYQQQANPLLSIHIYTPFMISMNDKNKQLTIIKH
jgi:hypothetical protein